MEEVFNTLFAGNMRVTFDHFSSLQVVILIFIGFLSGLFISYLYKLTFSGIGYSSSFVCVGLFTAISTLVIIAIGESVARAFALAGALSIIRFRTPVKDARDITFVFYSLIIGLSLGTGKVLIGVSSLITIGAFIYLYTKYQDTKLNGMRAVFRITCGSDFELEKQLKTIFGEHLSRPRILDVQHRDEGIKYVTFVSKVKNENAVSSIENIAKEIDQIHECSVQIQYDSIEM